MQGGAVPAGRQEEARSEAYLVVRCNDERDRILPSSAGFARASLGEVRPPSIGLSDRGGRGQLGVPPSEERWAFFNSLLSRGTSPVDEPPVRPGESPADPLAKPDDGANHTGIGLSCAQIIEE